MEAIEARGVFTVALSGGSLPGFLAQMKESFGSESPASTSASDVNNETILEIAQGQGQGLEHEQDLTLSQFFDKWHVILADERCVPSNDPDSNMGELKRVLFSHLPIPESQIHGINETLLEDDPTTAASAITSIAIEYERIVRQVIAKSDGQLDLAVLGFGPDGHTCSLFPNHALSLSLLQDDAKWVASLDDSPKPPPRRITITFPVWNRHTRHVIFCGAGDSKAPILQKMFQTVVPTQQQHQQQQPCSFLRAAATALVGSYTVTMTEPAPFPCAAVRPNSQGVQNTLTYIVDQKAMDGVTIQEA